ncbi:unnamed protein product [Polarella glacialis]|uniref:Uncharacterized protein n=1 Tax=Polarella glacialis TaxID=89957 RepID=A0A813J8P5_POLGL|nr:unnamed protein product [Polarella glacialis]CAE8668705.1 unnamed protein product [Polarella glacialis]
MAMDEQLARSIAMLVAEQCSKQVVALFAEFQNMLFTDVTAAVFNQLVECQVDFSATGGKSSSSLRPSVQFPDFSESACAILPKPLRDVQREDSMRDLEVSLKKQQEEQPQSRDSGLQARSGKAGCSPCALPVLHEIPHSVLGIDSSHEGDDPPSPVFKVPGDLQVDFSATGGKSSSSLIRSVQFPDFSESACAILPKPLRDVQREDSMRDLEVSLKKQQEEQPQSRDSGLQARSGKAGYSPCALPVQLEILRSVSGIDMSHGGYDSQSMGFNVPGQVHSRADVQPPVLPPVVLGLSPGTEQSRFRKSESFKKMALVRGRSRASASKFNVRRGLCAMERARLKTLVHAQMQLASVVPTESDNTREMSNEKTASSAWSDKNKSKSLPSTSGVQISMPWWLSLFGFQQSQCRCAIVMPFYAAAIFCCMVAAVAMKVVQLRDPDSLGGRFGNEIVLVMGLCSVACILQLNFRLPGQQSVVQATSEMFMNNVMLPDYVDLWLERCCRSSCEVAFLWFLSVAAEAVVLWTSAEHDPGKAVIHMAVFAILAAAYSLVGLYLLLVISAQAAMIDHFSATAADLLQDYKVLRHRWDQIQAILRRSAQCLAPSLLILTLSPVIIVIICTIELIDDNEYDAQSILVKLVPKSFELLGVIRVLSRIGEVTGNCDRLPVVLNSLLLGSGFDQEASDLIHFIERSKAGFYAFDAKVDYTVMSKVASVFSGGLLALLAKAVQL